MKKDVLCRIVGKVAVKGKKRRVGNIYGSKKKQPLKGSRSLWNEHNKAMLQFYRREFKDARERFKVLEKKSPGKDYLISKMTKDCDEYINSPPPKDWNGVEIMKTK